MRWKGRKLIWAFKYADLDKKHRSHPQMGKTIIIETHSFSLLCGHVNSLSAYHASYTVPIKQVQPSLAEPFVKMHFFYSTFSGEGCLPLQILKE